MSNESWSCQCCGGNPATVIKNKCPCWVHHFRECPWERKDNSEIRSHRAGFVVLDKVSEQNQQGQTKVSPVSKLDN